MSRPPLPKLALAALALLVVAHAVADSHAHEGELAEESCSVCVAGADLAPTVVAPAHALRLAPEGRKSDKPAVALLPARDAAYSARAPPFP